MRWFAHLLKLAQLTGGMMAILAIPGASIYLVPHVGGGALIHAAGGYVANTLIPAGVVEAFSAAAGVLGSAGGALSSAAATASGALTTPYIAVPVVIAAVAVGTYCYFHGIPAPVEAALSGAGLGTATKQGFMISLPKLAIALVLLGGAGFVAYKFYKSFMALRTARFIARRSTESLGDQAEVRSRSYFGDGVWEDFGQVLWSGAGAIRQGTVEGTQKVAKTAREAASIASELLTKLGATGTAAAYATAGTASDVGSRASSAISKLLRRFKR